jgi:hypothetical protein
MISVDVLEVLIRSVPQYFVFGALALFIFGWVNKKDLYGLIAEIILVVVGVMSVLVILSGMIPSPKTPGINTEHIELVTKVLLIFSIIALISIVSLTVRFFNKKPFKPLVVAIFVLSLIVFFQSTSISRIKFELNRPTVTITDTIQAPDTLSIPDSIE